MYCNFQKTYNSGKRSFSIDIEASFQLNAINVVYGNSGAGKTSLLRLLSGLDKVDSGLIRVNKKDWLNTKNKTFLPSHQREIAYVFQDYGLFPNMTVTENLEFAKKDINQTLLNEVVEMLELETLLKTKPNHLSGGQQQRIALARAIVQEPKFLFLDEPLTAIDETLRSKLQTYLIQLQKKQKFTVIMVSHNLQEVLKVASHVCVIHQGKATSQGIPSLLLKENPKNTLKAVVISSGTLTIDVVVETQKMTILKENILSKNYTIGDEVEIKIH
ncbi:ATP-binding cassette domain-containing protein [Wenyingzhuangia sp. chi5]|uniref:ATP-binding cassette domain-containing protein n=1 Tax=Wenyingzhuangia gilva TaxID=3057677 RepID=A0ABT8VUU2_9FLAO|nr:ATP-binding cassette domain-containing protein [Wenyingzhuangia sp. chi5]MDO3695743.1 ATP-binding cassette domain-containing protein [Wenyingzhuangia sp. chi5]